MATTPTNNVKRNRWASSSSSSSSSDDEDEAPRKRKAVMNGNVLKIKKPHARDAAISSNPTNDNKKAPPPPQQRQQKRHNPLLHGCRSVYDTYEQIHRVSEGAYGIVWKAKDLATGEICALKQIKFHAELEHSMNPRQLWKEGFPVTALREISVLLALSHESIVSVKEMVVGDTVDKVFMVMEFFDCDLKDALRKASTGGPLSQSNLKGILQQILSGMAHVHSKRYMHRDMKPSNLLVQRSTGRIALADFGLARRFYDPATLSLTLPVVTLWYRAPELLFGESKYGPAIDIWSMGCIFGELIQSGGNYSDYSAAGDHEDEEDQGNAIMKGQGEIDQIEQIFSLMGGPTDINWPSFSSLPHASLLRWKSVEEPQFHKVFRNSIASSQASFLDVNGLDLLHSMLRLDPSQRITAQAALEHAYFLEGVKPSIPHYFTEALQS